MDANVSDFFSSFAASATNALPALIFAVLLIIIGYIVGWIIKIVVVKVLNSSGLDEWMQQHNLSSILAGNNISKIIGSIIKWYVFFIFLKQAVEIVNLFSLKEAIGFWINFALLLIAAIVVIVAGLIIARYIRNAIESTKQPMKNIAGLVVELMVVYISIVMAIRIIGLPTQLLEWTFLIAFTGFVLAVALIFGISFGLAMQDEAKVIVKELKKKKK